jgi:hypothetical protein
LADCHPFLALAQWTAWRWGTGNVFILARNSPEPKSRQVFYSIVVAGSARHETPTISRSSVRRLVICSTCDSDVGQNIAGYGSSAHANDPSKPMSGRLEVIIGQYRRIDQAIGYPADSKRGEIG